MSETQEVKMTVDHVVLGERWKKGKKYPAEPREVRILVEELKVATLVNDTANVESKGA